VLDTYIFLHVLSVEAHYKECAYFADEKLFHISMQGARDGCTGLNQSCLARPQMTNRQGVALSISAIIQNV